MRLFKIYIALISCFLGGLTFSQSFINEFLYESVISESQGLGGGLFSNEGANVMANPSFMEEGDTSVYVLFAGALKPKLDQNQNLIGLSLPMGDRLRFNAGFVLNSIEGISGSTSLLNSGVPDLSQIEGIKSTDKAFQISGGYALDSSISLSVSTRYIKREIEQYGQMKGVGFDLGVTLRRENFDWVLMIHDAFGGYNQWDYSSFLTHSSVIKYSTENSLPRINLGGVYHCMKNKKDVKLDLAISMEQLFDGRSSGTYVVSGYSGVLNTSGRFSYRNVYFGLGLRDIYLQGETSLSVNTGLGYEISKLSLFYGVNYSVATEIATETHQIGVQLRL